MLLNLKQVKAGACEPAVEADRGVAALLVSAACVFAASFDAEAAPASSFPPFPLPPSSSWDCLGPFFKKKVLRKNSIKRNIAHTEKRAYIYIYIYMYVCIRRV